MLDFLGYTFMAPQKRNRLQTLLHCRIRVSLTDGRFIIGQLLAYDRYMNIVMVECEETRAVKTKSSSAQMASITRSLGMVVIRGEIISSLTIDNLLPVSSNGNYARIPASIQITSNSTYIGN